MIIKKANNLDGLIEALKEVKRIYGNMPVSVNVVNEKVTSLNAVCVDEKVTSLNAVCVDDCDDEPQLLLECDLEENAPYKAEFSLLSQSNKLENELGFVKKEYKDKPCHFLDNLDAVADMLTIDNKEEFLKSYSYLSSADYDVTRSMLYPRIDEKPLSQYNLDVCNNITKLMEEAKDLMNNEDVSPFTIKGKELLRVLNLHKLIYFKEIQEQYMHNTLK